MEDDDDHPLAQSPHQAKVNQPSSSTLSTEEQLSKYAAEIEIARIVKQVWLTGRRQALFNDEHFIVSVDNIRQQVLEIRQAQEEDINIIAKAVFELSVHPTLSRSEATVQAKAMYTAIGNLSRRLGNAVLHANPGIEKQQ